MDTAINMEGNTHKALRIYLVDDDDEDQEIFREALHSIDMPIDLRVFDSAKEVLAQLEISERPDMVFLDLYMPEIDGEDCLREIRDRKTCDAIPVVIYSTEFDLDRIERLFEMGANRYLRKPDIFESLVASLENTIQSLERNALGGYAVINIIA